MAFDQDITYRVKLDDTNFQARLTQLRASLDSSMSGGGAAAMMMAMGGGATGPMTMGGLADFGTQIRPITYTPPAMAMQPHFGMVQVQQTLGQAGLATMGPFGMGAAGGAAAIGGFMSGGLAGAQRAAAPYGIPDRITASEYFNASMTSFGNRLGDAAAVGVGTAANVAGSLVAGGAGFRAGASLFAGGAGGFVGGMLGSMAFSAVPAAIGGAVMDAYGENRAIQEQLAASSFRFMTGGGPDVDPITGRGMSRRARTRVASAIQEMELGDPRFGIDEYQQILEGGAQMDLFAGSGDAQEFQRKFKGLVENLKTVTATLHTSLKEGMEVIRGLRDIGVTDPGAVNQMVLTSEVRGRASGRTGMEMMAIGQSGAEIFRGTGVSMARGFELMQQNVESVRQGLNAGTLSRESVAQAGGETALAQRLTAGALASFQTTLGRGMMMAAYNPATGALDTNQALNFGASAFDMMGKAAALGPAGIIGLQANQEELISSMSPMQMRAFDINQRMAMSRTMASAYGVGGRDAFIYTSKMQGKSMEEINADLAFMQQDPEKYAENERSAMAAVRNQAMQEDVRNRFNPLKTASNWFRRTIIEPQAQTLVGISSALGEATERFALSARGIAAVDQTLISKDAREAAIGGGTMVSLGLGSYASAEGGMMQRMWGQSSSAALEAAANAEFSGGEGGVPATSRVGNLRVYSFGSEDEARAYAASTREDVRGLGFQEVSVNGSKKRMFLGTTVRDAAEATNKARGLAPTSAQEEEAAKEVIDDKMLGRFTGVATRAKKAGKEVSLADVSQFAYGKDFSDLSGTQRAMVKRLLTSESELTTAATKEYEQMTGASMVSDIGGASAGDLSARQRSKREELNALIASQGGVMQRIGNAIGASQYSKMSQTAMGAAIKTLSSPGDVDVEGNAIRAMRAEGISQTAAENFLATLADTPSDQRQRILRANEEVEAYGKALGTQGNITGTGSTASAVGHLSVETTKRLEEMSGKLIENYKIILEMQQQFNAMKAKK